MTIEIKVDKEKDINSFYENIFGEEFIRKRGFVKKRIFKCYPELEEKLASVTDIEIRKKEIYDCVSDLYIDHDAKLQSIVQNLTLLFEQNKDKIFNGLSQTMDLDSDDIPNITIIPSFKPNSTFGMSTINLSILSEIFQNQTKPYIDIFIHEITHIIRNQKVGKIYNTVGKLGSLAHEDLKEIVAPIIIRDPVFKDVLQSEYLKKANDKQQLLSVSVGGIQYNIVDYFESIYQDMKKKGIPFEEIMKIFVKIFLSIEDQINAKHLIYNEYGSGIDKGASLKILEEKGYLIPIVIS